MRRIVSTEFKKKHFGPTTINATFDDGSKEDIISFFEDEISFSEEELIGKTESEASALHFAKDKAFLTS